MRRCIGSLEWAVSVGSKSGLLDQGFLERYFKKKKY